MKNRQLDVTFQSAGLGVASIRDLSTSIKIVVVPIPAEVVAKVGDAAYQPSIIPANTYTGLLMLVFVLHPPLRQRALHPPLSQRALGLPRCLALSVETPLASRDRAGVFGVCAGL